MNKNNTLEIECTHCRDVVENEKQYLFLPFCSTRCIESYCKEHTACHCATCQIEFCHVPDDCIIEVDGNRFCSPKCKNDYIYERNGLNQLNALRQGDFN